MCTTNKLLSNKVCVCHSDSDGLLSGLQIEYHANVRFRRRRSNSVFLQLQFEAFYTVNLLNAKWKVVPARNSGWKKRKSI